MSRIAVRPGQHVNRGRVIGYIGSSGLSTGRIFTMKSIATASR